MSIGSKMTVKRQHTELTPSAYKALVISADKQEASPWALDAVRYSSVGGKRMLELFFPEFSLGVPLLAIRELTKATVKDLQQLRLSPAGDTIVADTLDAHISVEGLLKDLSNESPGFSQLVSTLFATRGGKRSTEKKRVTSVENGRKGGRPRKVEESAFA
jgi:hypothetical protein